VRKTLPRYQKPEALSQVYVAVWLQFLLPVLLLIIKFRSSSINVLMLFNMKLITVHQETVPYMKRLQICRCLLVDMFVSLYLSHRWLFRHFGSDPADTRIR